MKDKHHKTLTLKNWSQYPLAKQMLSIGSELSRILHLRHQASQKKCLERALELIDLTVVDPKLQAGRRRREILRLREVLALEYSKVIDTNKIGDYYQYCLTFAKFKV